MNRSIRDERSLNMAYLGVVTSGLVHEIRNPLTVIKNFIHVFPEFQDLTPKGREIISHVQLASDHVTGIVNDFAEFIRNGKLNVGDYDLHDILEEAVQLMNPIAQERAVRLLFVRESSESLPVHVDRDKMRQVFVNLINNGIDAIEPNANERQITVRLVRSRDSAVIDVIDTGSGIPEAQWDAIFTPFTSSKDSGFGLGLALCKFIVLSNGGSIHVHHSGETGTIMRVTLPLSNCDGDHDAEN